MLRKPKQSTLVAALGLALAMPVGAADPGRTTAGTTSSPASSTARADATHQVRVSKLIGMDVYSQSGQRLGDVKDVIVDTNSGRVHYAILSLGGFLGLGDKLFAIPLS